MVTMDDVPTEIILLLGDLLDGPGLYSCIQVNRRWYRILSPLVWRSISKLQWHHPRFPTLMRVHTQLPATHPLQTLLLCVQYLEWYSNHAIADKYISIKDIAPFALPDTKRIDRQKQRIASQPPWVQMATLLGMMKNNLLTLVLHSSELKLPRNTAEQSWSESTPPMLNALLSLQTLKRLDLTFEGHPFTREKLTVLFPLLSRLEELVLGGTWYTFAAEDFEGETPFEGPLVGALLDEPIKIRYIDTEKYNQPWRLRFLQTSAVGLALLSLCPELRRLRVVWDQSMNMYLKAGLDLGVYFFTLGPLWVMCPVLEELRLEDPRVGSIHGSDHVHRCPLVDFDKSLSRLSCLRSLKYQASKLKDVTFLSLPPDGPHEQEVDMVENRVVFPHLWDLELQIMRLRQDVGVGDEGGEDDDSDREIDCSLGEVLRTRRELRTFVVEGHEFDPKYFLEGTTPFVKVKPHNDNDTSLGVYSSLGTDPIPATVATPETMASLNKTCKEKTQSETAWVCQDLEHFSIRWRHLYTAEEKQSFWRPIFAELSKLSRLKTLDMVCPYLNLSIAEAKEGCSVEGWGDLCWLAGLEQLQILHLITIEDSDGMLMGGTEWKGEDLIALVNKLPRLRRVYLGEPLLQKLVFVQGWMAEHKRRRIEIGTPKRRWNWDERVYRVFLDPGYGLEKGRNVTGCF